MKQSTLELKNIELSKLVASPTNPRKTFDAESIGELAQSISEKGVLQPIVVRKVSGNGLYEVVAGERRFRASKIANQATIPAVVRDLTDDEALELQIIENLQRKDVHPMEEAAGFKHLQAVKAFDVQEIARRVGKSPFYVSQRLKLNDLIPEWQKLFYEGKLLMGAALHVSKISIPDQKELLNDKKHDSGVIEISKWDLRKYHNDLSNPPFDATDHNLKKDMGACTNCTFNSAVNLLFPDQAVKPICLNSQCFRQKANLSFDRELKKALGSPEVAIVSSNHYYSEDNFTRQLAKDGIKIIASRDYSVINEPEIYEDDRDNYDSDKEYNEAVAEAKADFEEAKAAYEKRIASGKFIKAYVVQGDEKGKYIRIELDKKKSGSEAKKKVEAGDAATEDFKAEIERIQTREKRSKELDAEKVHVQVYDALLKSKEFLNDKPFLPEERVALMVAIYDKAGYGTRNLLDKLIKASGSDYNHKAKLPKLQKFTDKEFNLFCRQYFLSELSENMQNGISGRSLAIRAVADKYLKQQIAEIELEQESISNKRQDRVSKRIAQLRTLMKQTPTPKKAAKKK